MVDFGSLALRVGLGILGFWFGVWDFGSRIWGSGPFGVQGIQGAWPPSSTEPEMRDDETLDRLSRKALI